MNPIKGRHILFHKDIPVLSLYFNHEYDIAKIEDIFNKEHIFPGLYLRQLDRKVLAEWLYSRGIPAKRKEMKQILKENKVESRKELIIRNMGLGLKKKAIRETGKT